MSLCEALRPLATLRIVAPTELHSKANYWLQAAEILFSTDRSQSAGIMQPAATDASPSTAPMLMIFIVGEILVIEEDEKLSFRFWILDLLALSLLYTV